MIVEERIYTCYCGKSQQYVKMYEEEGLALQRPILGHLLGYFTTELGELNPEHIVTPGIFVQQVVKIARVATQAGGFKAAA